MTISYVLTTKDTAWILDDSMEPETTHKPVTLRNQHQLKALERLVSQQGEPDVLESKCRRIVVETVKELFQAYPVLPQTQCRFLSTLQTYL